MVTKMEDRKAASVARLQAIAREYVTDRVPTPELARRYGVSRSTVTLALRTYVPADVRRERQRAQHAAAMRGNRNGAGHTKTEAGLARLRARETSANPNWRGDAVALRSWYHRMAKQFPLAEQICAMCGVPAQVRHHRDENPRHNVPENIQFLCRACHARHHLAQRVA